MRTSLPKPTRIGQVIVENAKVKTFILETSLEAEPGQFVMIWLPRVNEKPFSLVDADPLTITVARVGPFTSELHRLEVGDRLWFRGPLGRGFELVGENLLLVGGGYGVAPLAFLAKRAREARCEDLLSQGDFDAVYACGPEAMLDRLAEICMVRGVPCQLSREGYMRCGLGICGSCQRNGLLVCREGPVFTLPIPSKRPSASPGSS